jgi:hypothetical protein
MVNIRTISNLEGMQLSKTNTDLDSHAYQSVLGCNTLVVYDFDKLVIIVYSSFKVKNFVN